MSDSLMVSGSKEQVAFHLMEKIAINDLKLSDGLQKDAANYYISLYTACLLAVYGEGVEPSLKIADQRAKPGI